MDPDPAATVARPRVSVVIVVKDGEAHLGRQLAALDAQVGAPSFEVLVVDNGSRDGTAALARRWIQAGPVAASSARLVDASAKPGIPFARNQGALASRGEVLAFCDADDAVHPGWVAAYAAALTTPGMAGGRNHPVDESHRPIPGIMGPGLTLTAHLPFAAGCNFATTRDCYFAVGGFDESLPRYGFDDVDFSWRVQDAGYRLQYVEAAAVDFTVSGKLRSVRKEYLLAKARMAVVRRHPDFDPTPYSLGHCLADVARTAVLLPVRMVRPRAPRSREVRWLVDAAGRLGGQWHYGVRRRDAEPVLLDGDPLAT